MNSGTVSAGINFKRDTNSTATLDHSECEGSAAIPIFSAFMGSGVAAFQSALVEAMGEAWLNTTVPSNYTVVGWTGKKI